MGNDAEVGTQVLNLLPEKSPTEPKLLDNALTRALRTYCFIPQRFVLSIFSLLGVCNAYTMRVCLNLAITQMVKRTKEYEIMEKFHNTSEAACPSDLVHINATVVENPYAIFEWDEKTQGLLLSAFFYGYASTQVPGGYLAERYGGKWIVGVGLLSTALFTFLTPVVIRAGGAPWLFVFRILQGIGEGPTMPGLMIMLAKWIPPHERSIHSAVVFGGGQIGNVFGSVVSGYLLSGGRDWAYVFYFFGGFGVFGFILWSLFCYSSPDTHPFITREELDYLKENVTIAENKESKDPVPWKAIIRSAPVWALIFASIGHDWGLYAMVSDLPKYTHDVLKFNIVTTGSLTALPFVAMLLFSFASGAICDLCVKKGWHTIKTGRIVYTTIVATGPAICIVLASYAGCDRNAAMAYFILSMGLMGGFYAGMKVNVLDLAPNFAGSLTSLVNTTSTFTGMIVPFLIGLLTPNSTISEWRVAFWVCFVILVCTNVVYCIWAEGTQQWWDDVRQYGYPYGWKHGPLVQETNPEQPETIKLEVKKDIDEV